MTLASTAIVVRVCRVADPRPKTTACDHAKFVTRLPRFAAPAKAGATGK